MNSNEQAAAGALAMFAGMGIFMLIVGLAAHLFFGYCMKLIAEKTGNEQTAGIWWVPILNFLIPFRVAKKPTSWFLVGIGAIALQILAAILTAVTGSAAIGMILGILAILGYIAYFVLWVITWMAVAEARGQEKFWGVIAALVGIIGIPYLAFVDSKTAPATT
jgi:hypothetical protein